MKPRKLTEAQEDDILQKWNLRKVVSSKGLCAAYDISRATLRDVLRRARARNADNCAKVAITSDGR